MRYIIERMVQKSRFGSGSNNTDLAVKGVEPPVEVAVEILVGAAVDKPVEVAVGHQVVHSMN